MNTLIETLNAGGDQALHLAWPMLWQSSLLVGLLFALEWALRRKVRAAVRYALWLMVVAKLLLPPSLALPTGVGWWLRSAAAAPKARSASIVISYGPGASSLPADNSAVLRPARTPLSAAAGALAASSIVSLGLLAWMLWRWRAVAREAHQADAAPEWLEALLEETRRAAGLRRPVQLRLLDKPVSPAVCGLLRPAILLPRSLSEQLSPAQLRAVLLHELVHLRRGDVWLNCLQALVQLAYWWHPLLWLANARIRRLREEAVDDAVMQALRDEAETYAPTLLEVAKLALRRPLASLGLVGILESHSSLRQRIQRLLDFHPPRKAGLTLGSALCVVAFGALALPMGQGPAKPNEAAPAFAPSESKPRPDLQVQPLAISVTNLKDDLTTVLRADSQQADRAQAPEPTPVLNNVVPASTGNEPSPLYVRVFKVDPRTFLDGLRTRAGMAQTWDPELQAIHKAAQDCFRRAGADLAPPKSLFFNKAEGTLTVRATLPDLDIIEKSVQALNIAPPQIKVRTKFIELPVASLAAFWQDIGTTDPAGTGGTNWTTVLTPAQARAALKAVESTAKADLLSESSVTTLDGRQAQIQVVDIKTIVMGINPRALTPPGVNPSSVSTNANDTNALYLAQTLPFGPTLDVIPHAGSDGRTIRMTLIPSLTEFLGYDQPTNPVPVYIRGKKEEATQPLPHFRVRQVTTTTDVLDGYTLVIGGGVAESITRIKDSVPVLGGLPLLGRLFRSESSSTEKKQLLVLVTPTFIDPAGNRIHRDDQPPPAPNRPRL
jgi:beta-lactamase regulating signal transducer with metallopeptidase domain